MKQKILRVLNVLMIILFFSLMITVILYTSVPHYIGDETVGDLHGYTGKAFFLCGFLHLILNWSWIRNTYFKKRGKGR